MNLARYPSPYQSHTRPWVDGVVPRVGQASEVALDQEAGAAAVWRDSDAKP
jgi:hypothetical protein